MARQPLVLLIPADRRTGALTRAGLEGYGYDVLVAGTVEEALDLLRSNRRVSVLVVDVRPEKTSDGLALAQAARRSDPTIHVIYTCGAPYKLSEREGERRAVLAYALSSASARRGHRADLKPTLLSWAWDARSLTGLVPTLGAINIKETAFV
jgi:CheY-like chemotaxis protein